jgi:hypothetical protein
MVPHKLAGMLRGSSHASGATDHEAKNKAARAAIDDDFTKEGSFSDLRAVNIELQSENMTDNVLMSAVTRTSPVNAVV